MESLTKDAESRPYLFRSCYQGSREVEVSSGRIRLSREVPFGVRIHNVIAIRC